MSPRSRVSDWLDSGVVALTGFIPPGSAATMARCWGDEIERLTAAIGEPVRVSGAHLLAERAALSGTTGPTSTTSLGGACRLMPSVDGWVAVSLPRTSDLDLVPALVGGPVGGPVGDLWTAVAEWAATRTAAQIVGRARLLGLAVSRVGEASLGRSPIPAWVAGAIPASVAGGSPLLVVDFSALWAGPLCASLLGLAGARVVKVETATRPDGARRGDPRFFDLQNAGHESVCIDPRLPSERAALHALVSRADVVIEASRPRALAGWGLSADDAVRNGTTWVSITGYGRAQADRVGFGDDVASGAGLVGWPDGDGAAPVFVGDAIADPLTGLAAAVAVLRTLTSGTSLLIDLAMASVVASTLDGTPATFGAQPAAAPPGARPISGPAHALGADTARVLATLGS